MATKPRRSKAEDETPTEAASIRSGGIDLEAEQVVIGGDVVGRDKIVNNIQHIYERALTAAEEAEQEKAIEAKYLAQGVSMFAQRLQARASEATDAAKGSPYMGLLEYRLSDVEIFFGREKAIPDVLGCLQNGPLTVLQSESGAGKTSLLQAGISPRLIAAGHLPLYLRPYNVEPSYVIKRAFISNPGQTPNLAAAPSRDFLRQVCSVLGPNTTLYIFLDQFEEFFTLLDDPTRDEFVRELAECLDDESLNVRWLLAVRAEYFGDLANFRPRIRNPFENDYRLNRLTRAEAVQVITEPAALRGAAFEPGLVDTLLDDLGKNEIAPPQLQLVCAALFDELAGGETTITRALYDREGGAAGILRGYLEQVLSRNLRREDRAAARWVLESLISSEQQRIIRSHAELADELSKRGVTPQTLDSILNQLVDSRLLRAEETESGLAYELAHDYLLQEIRLDPEAQARKAAQELLEQEVRVYRRYKTLLTEDRLKVIEPYRHELTFTPEAEALFTESRNAVQKERAARERRRNVLFASAIAVAIVMTILAVYGLTSAAEARRQSQIAFVRQLAAQSVARRSDRPDLAFLLSLETTRLADAIGDTFDGRNSLLGALQHSSILPTFRHGHTDSVWSVAFSPDGQTLASGSEDGSIILWDVASRQRLGEPLAGHRGPVWSVAFSPDGNTLALGGEDNSIILWDVAGRQRLGEPLTGHTDRVWSVAFSPDGKTLASGGDDGSIILWDVAGRQRLGTLLTGHNHWVRSVAFSPDGQTLASGGEDSIILWDVAGRHQLGEPLRGHTGPVLSVAFSPDGQTLASGSWDNDIILWDVTSRQQLGAPLTGHRGPVWSVAFSPDGQTLASGGADDLRTISAIFLTISEAVLQDSKQLALEGADGSIILWDVASRQRLGEPLTAHTGPVSIVAFSPDGQTLVSAGADRSIILWDVSALLNTSVVSRQQLGAPLDAPPTASSVAFSPDGKTLASSSWDGNVILWNVSALLNTSVAGRQWLGEPFTGHIGPVWSVAFSPDGKTLASGGDDRNIILWDVASRQRLGEPLTGHTGPVATVAFRPDGKTLASSSSDTTIILWDVVSRQRLGEPLTGHKGEVLSVAFSPDGKTLESRGDDGSIILWEVASRQRLGAPLTGHTGEVWSVAFGPDSQTLATGGEDGIILLWDMAGRQRLGEPLTGHTGSVNSVAFSPDGKTLASGGGDRRIILWDVAGRQRLGAPLTGHKDFVYSVAFSPDGQTLASGGEDGIVLWDVASRQQLGAPLTVYNTGAMEFSPDSQTLASAGSLGGFPGIILWDVGLESWKNRLCNLVGRNFTQAEWAQYFGERGEPYRKTCEQWPEGE